MSNQIKKIAFVRPPSSDPKRVSTRYPMELGASCSLIQWLNLDSVITIMRDSHVMGESEGEFFRWLTVVSPDILVIDQHLETSEYIDAFITKCTRFVPDMVVIKTQEGLDCSTWCDLEETMEKIGVKAGDYYEELGKCPMFPYLDEETTGHPCAPYTRYGADYPLYNGNQLSNYQLFIRTQIGQLVLPQQYVYRWVFDQLCRFQDIRIVHIDNSTPFALDMNWDGYCYSPLRKVICALNAARNSILEATQQLFIWSAPVSLDTYGENACIIASDMADAGCYGIRVQYGQDRDLWPEYLVRTQEIKGASKLSIHGIFEVQGDTIPEDLHVFIKSLPIDSIQITKADGSNIENQTTETK